MKVYKPWLGKVPPNQGIKSQFEDNLQNTACTNCLPWHPNSETSDKPSSQQKQSSITELGIALPQEAAAL